MEDSSEDDRKLTVEEKKAHDDSRAHTGLESPNSEKKVKPALKKNKKSPGQAKKALKWDEEAIEEHDLLRGTRMKIDEAKTPYTQYDSGQESDGSHHSQPKSPINQKNAISWDTLQNKLDSVAAVREAYPSSPSSHGGDQSDAEAEQRGEEMRQLEFKEHRKRHYNEMDLVRKFRQEHSEGALAVDEHGGDADDEKDAGEE
jgi:protein phosphatase inhibitor 2